MARPFRRCLKKGGRVRVIGAMYSSVTVRWAAGVLPRSRHRRQFRSVKVGWGGWRPTSIAGSPGAGTGWQTNQASAQPTERSAITLELKRKLVFNLVYGFFYPIPPFSTNEGSGSETFNWRTKKSIAYTICWQPMRSRFQPFSELRLPSSPDIFLIRNPRNHPRPRRQSVLHNQETWLLRN